MSCQLARRSWSRRPSSHERAANRSLHCGSGNVREAFVIWVLSHRVDKRDGTDMSTGDKTKGKIKETLGALTGSDDLRQEGQAQQHKGHHLAQAAEACAVAEEHEREAELFEHEERYRQELLY